MIWYCHVKTPHIIEVSESEVTLRFRTRKPVSWAKKEIESIVIINNPLGLFVNEEIVVSHKDGQPPICIRPEVKGGKELGTCQYP
jgi:hypothetical protein